MQEVNRVSNIAAKFESKIQESKQQGRTKGNQVVQQKSGSEATPTQMAETKAYGATKFKELTEKYQSGELTSSEFTQESNHLLHALNNKLVDIKDQLKNLNKSDLNYNQKVTLLLNKAKSIQQLSHKILQAVSEKPLPPPLIKGNAKVSSTSTEPLQQKAKDSDNALTTIVGHMTSYSTKNKASQDILEDRGVANSDTFLTSYGLLGTSSELFQSLNSCFNDPLVSRSKQIDLLDFATKWYSSGAYTSEAKSNKTIDQQAMELINSAKKSTNSEIVAAGARLEAAKKAVEEKPSPRSLNDLKNESRNKAPAKQLIDGVKKGSVKATSKEYKNGVSSCANDLKVVFSNLKSAVNINEYMIDPQKENFAELAPALNDKYQITNQIGKFVFDQLTFSAIGGSKEMYDKQQLARVANFYLDVANEAYKNGDISTAFAIANGFMPIEISKLIESKGFDKNVQEKYSLLIKNVDKKSLRANNLSVQEFASADMIVIAQANNFIPSEKGDKTILNQGKLGFADKVLAPVVKEKAALEKGPLQTSFFSEVLDHVPINPEFHASMFENLKQSKSHFFHANPKK